MNMNASLKDKKILLKLLDRARLTFFVIRIKDMIKDQEIKELTIDLITQQSTMALATAENDVPWATPVYFVFYRSAFFFFSNPNSRHIQEAYKSEKASATIYPFVYTWKEIRGVQMSGHIEALSPSITTAQVIKAYIKKFPFAKDFFTSDEPLNLESFINRFRVRLYQFKPHLVLYLDNRIQFGYRTEVQLT